MKGLMKFLDDMAGVITVHTLKALKSKKSLSLKRDLGLLVQGLSNEFRFKINRRSILQKTLKQHLTDLLELIRIRRHY